MNAKFRIVIPASAAVAAILLTACADKPIRVPGGTFVEEPYTGETTTKTHTVISNGEEITDTEVIFIDDEVPVGPVEDKTQTGQQDSGAAQGGNTSAQEDGVTLQPIDQEQIAKSNAPEGSVEYKVVKGDTLWSIGMVYGVSVARLAEINGIDEKAPLKIGQVLMIPPDAKNAVGKPVEKKQEKKQETKPASTSAATTKPATATKTQPVAKDGETLYVVKSGDNLSMIAYRHHVKLADLVAANKIDPKATLRVGQTLVIPAAGAKAATATTTTTKSASNTATTTKTEPAATTKPATTTTATAATTKTEPAATTKPATTQTKGGEGTGGVVEPIGGSSMGSGSGSASASTSSPAATTKPATATTSAPALDPVSSLSDADVISVQIDSESTLEEVANIHDRNLEDLIRLNPEFKSGQKIPAGTAVKMPLF